MEPLSNKLRRRILGVAGILMMVVAVIQPSCDDEMKGKTFLTSDDMTLYSYIVDVDPSMSMFLEIADKVQFGGTLQAYGRYTCFIPTNDALNAYLSAAGKSIGTLTEDECFTLLKYHIVNLPEGVDSLTSASFVDGRLSVPNMLSKYLTIRTVTVDDNVSLQVDRKAVIVEKDIRTANGYIQKINAVLEPPALTVGEQIMALPENYSLYKEVMKQTGWIDTLTTGKAAWYTAIVQSDETFASMGINSRDDLIAALRVARKDIYDYPQDPLTMTKDDSLYWSFAAYQVFNSLNYVVDLAKSSSLLTCAPNQPMTFKLNKGEILVNEFIDGEGNISEHGAPINRASTYTDLSCFNGVLLELGINPERDNFFGPVARVATAVYWDVCDQPEFRSHPNYTKANIDHIPTTDLSQIWCYNAQGEEIDAENMKYTFNANQTDDKWQVVNHDYLQYRVQDFAYVDFKLPLLIEGTYNLWTCIRRDGNPIGVRVQFVFMEEGQAEQRLKTRDMYYKYTSDVKSEADMVNKGLKRYHAGKRNDASFAVECGMIDVKTTGRHMLRMIVVNGGTKSENSFLDMFQFIPPDQDQFWPLFDRAGNRVYADTPCEEIFPYAPACPSGYDTNAW
jgi:uncharacterized surface protein with fasciclin (FAS1) repeats